MQAASATVLEPCAFGGKKHRKMKLTHNLIPAICIPIGVAMFIALAVYMAIHGHLINWRA